MMSRKEMEILNLAEMLKQCTQERYEANKAVLLAVSANNEHLTDFLKKLFALVDKMRPQLIEMKEGAAV